MRIGTSAFGPYDVLTISEIVKHMDQYPEGEVIYVEDSDSLEPWTPAAVTSEHISSDVFEHELGFRRLGDIDDAREALEMFGSWKNDDELRELLQQMEQWCT